MGSGGQNREIGDIASQPYAWRVCSQSTLRVKISSQGVQLLLGKGWMSLADP